MSVCDKVVVLRDGLLINSVKTKDTNVNQITEWMIGRKIDNNEATEEVEEKDRKTILNIQELWVDMPGEMVKGS